MIYKVLLTPAAKRQFGKLPSMEGCMDIDWKSAVVVELGVARG